MRLTEKTTVISLHRNAMHLYKVKIFEKKGTNKVEGAYLTVTNANASRSHIICLFYTQNST